MAAAGRGGRAAACLIITLMAWTGPARADLPNGGSQSGAIDVIGDQDSYTFDATAGDHLELRVVDLDGADLYPRIELYAPSGGAYLAVGQGITVGGIAHEAPETGTYTVVVRDNSNGQDATGPYRLHFARMPGASELGSLSSGGVHHEVIETGDLDTYSFAATAGDHVELRIADLEGLDLYPRIELYGPAGGSYLAVGQGVTVGGISHEAPETGTYVVVVKDASNGIDAAGPYALHFARVPGANELGALASGGLHQDTIDVGDVDTYTLEATAGDHLELRVADLAAGSLYPRIELYGPAGGSHLAVGQGVTVGGISHEAPETGAYVVVVKDASNGIDGSGAYALHYVRAPGERELGVLTNGAVHNETLDTGDIDSYVFTAAPGDHVELRVADLGLTGLYPRIELYGPAGGGHLSVGQGTLVGALAFDVTTGGDYTVVVKDASNGIDAAGPYALHFVRIPGADEHGSLHDGDLLLHTIDLGDLDSFTFNAEAGDELTIDVNDLSAGSLYPRVEVFGPAGGGRVALAQHHTAASIAYTAAYSGTYTVLVKDASNGVDATGDYELAFTRDGEPAAETRQVPLLPWWALAAMAVMLGGLAWRRT